MTTPNTDLAEQIEEVVRELIRDKGNRVHEWPEDEAAAYRDSGGFAPGRAAVETIRVAKGVAAVMPLVDAAVKAGKAEALREAALDLSFIEIEDDFERTDYSTARDYYEDMSQDWLRGRAILIEQETPDEQ